MTHTDTELLNWVEVQAVPGMGWIARNSSTGRGFRVHQDHSAKSKTAREAISQAMGALPERWYRCNHEWESYIADGVVPYQFCKKCKSTLHQGLVRPLKPWKI